MNEQSNSGEQIPAGFTKETWENMTPEQQQTYRQAASQNSGDSMQAQQDQMVKEAKKKAVFGMIFSSIRSLVSRILSGLFRR